MAWWQDEGLTYGTEEYWARVRERLDARKPSAEEKANTLGNAYNNTMLSELLGYKYNGGAQAAPPQSAQPTPQVSVPQGRNPSFDMGSSSYAYLPEKQDVFGRPLATVTERLQALQGGGDETPKPTVDPRALELRERMLERVGTSTQSPTNPAAVAEQDAEVLAAYTAPRGAGIFTRSGGEIPTGNGYVGRDLTNVPSLPIGTERPRLLPGQVYIPGRGVGDTPGGQARRDELLNDAYAAIAAPASDLGGMTNAEDNDALMKAEIKRLEGGRGTEVFTPFTERNREEAERQARTSRNLESFRNALVGPESFPTETAAQIGDKRELDRRKALIETMEDGPAKQDALAALQDEETAKRTAGLKDSDRFEGLKGSPDWKARQGRIAAYEQKLKALQDGRVITKREAEQKAHEMKVFEQEDAKIANKTKELKVLEKDLELRREILGAEVDSKAQATYQKKLEELEKEKEAVHYRRMGIDKKHIPEIKAAEGLLEAEDPATYNVYSGFTKTELGIVWRIASEYMTSDRLNGKEAFGKALQLYINGIRGRK
jgi:hypothetical protein